MPELVREFPAQELYLLIREHGEEDALELLRHATCEQVALFLDMDCWSEDCLDTEKTLEWLARMLALGEEKILQLGRELDLELWALILGKHLTVLRGLEAFDSELEPPPLDRLAGIYEVEYDSEAGAKIVGALLEIFYTQDTERYLAIMETLRSELPSILEEECYQFRSGRLLDLGFEERSGAASVFSYLNPEDFHSRAAPQMKPWEFSGYQGGMPLRIGQPGRLLGEILSQGISDRARYQLSLLVNKVLSCDGADLGDLAQIRFSVESVYRYLNLGLEYLDGGDLQKSQERFESCELHELFRLGFSLTLDLKRSARKLQKSRIAPYLDGPFRAFLDGLTRPRPMLYEGVDREDRAGQRPFAQLGDVRMAQDWLLSIERQRRLFEERFGFELQRPEAMSLEGCIPHLASELTLSEIFLTALINRLLGRAFVPDPIVIRELPEIHARLSRNGKVEGAFREEVVAWVESLEPGAGGFAEFCLDNLEAEFCSVREQELDPRYVGGLILRVSQVE